jgi:SAM-dependent methyltransferase
VRFESPPEPVAADPRPSRPVAAPHAATLRRSVTLFRAFLVEQTDPGRFYGAIAADSVAQLGQYVSLGGKLVLDVGGGPGYFASAFTGAGARYVRLEPDAGDLTGTSAGGDTGVGALRASGMELPIRTGSVDVCYSSNVLEHVPDPPRMLDEMVRVTRPGGIVFASFTPWWSQWGGHETAPWHYLGGRQARRRYVRRHGHEPKNKFGESLFAVSVADGLRWSRRQQDADVVHVLPRYNPWWSRWLLRVPVVREVVTWNLVLVLRKR